MQLNVFPSAYFLWKAFVLTKSLHQNYLTLPVSWWCLSDDDGWWFEDATELWIVTVLLLYLYQLRRITHHSGWGWSLDRVEWEVWESVELGWLQRNVEGNEKCRDVQVVQGHFSWNSSAICKMLLRLRGQLLSHKEESTGLFSNKLRWIVSDITQTILVTRRRLFIYFYIFSLHLINAD
jgi:hypothetical protein